MLESHPYYAGIVAAILADQTPHASGLVDGRIHADQLPDNSPLPAIRFALLTDVPHQRLKSGENVTADVQCDVYAHRADKANAWTIDQLVRRALDRKGITVEGFVGVQCMCMERGRPYGEPGFYRIVSRFRLWGSAS
jgi:hypothetical protein